jgi:hypothetical protein
VKICHQIQNLLFLVLRRILAQILLTGLVHLHHELPGEVQGEGGSKKSEEAVRDHGVVKNLGLGAVSGLEVFVLELLAHGAVADCDCDASSEDTASLPDDG